MSPTFLLVMSLGPVQDFIAQARRTRDLWFGSQVLSKLSLEAAKAAMRLGAELIFPALVEGEEAAPGVPNKLLMLVEQGDPRDVARASRKAACDRLRALALGVWHKHPLLVDELSLDTAHEQLETFLEFQAAWCPFSAPDSYLEALSHVEEALAGSKRLRAFAPWRRQRGGRHKSSLDGARESVLRRGPREGGGWSRFRIGRREELDLIGLLKRAGKEPGQFTPIPTIGLAAYTALAAEKQPEAMEALRAACHRLGLTPVRHWDRPWVGAFPFDAQVLLSGRASLYLAEQDPPADAEAERFGGLVRPILQAMGEPFPYVACLVADGDKMGDTLRALARHGPKAHQALSRALSRFASEARRILEVRHQGVLVYAGGDDVLGFVCLPDALACAAELSQAFTDALRRGLEGTGVRVPTLSVGLGVGHVLESLGDLLGLGRSAGRLAKEGTEGQRLPEEEKRDGLALLARMHSGREHAWRRQWSAGAVKEFEAAMALRESGRLPLTKVREVCTALRRVPREVESPQEALRWRRVLVGEVRRILARVEVGTAEKELTPGEAGLSWSDNASLGELHMQVETWAERMFLAELFLRAIPHPRISTRGAA